MKKKEESSSVLSLKLEPAYVHVFFENKTAAWVKVRTIVGLGRKELHDCHGDCVILIPFVVPAYPSFFPDSV